MWIRVASSEKGGSSSTMSTAFSRARSKFCCSCQQSVPMQHNFTEETALHTVMTDYYISSH